MITDRVSNNMKTENEDDPMKSHIIKTSRSTKSQIDEGLCYSRRGLMQTVGICTLGAMLPQEVEGAQKNRPKFKVLDEETQFDIGNKGQEIIEKAYKIGHKLEKEHGGCCRCTVAALQKSVDFIPKDKDLFRAASCLDGGATPTGTQNCGAFTGLGMVIGWLCGANEFGNTKLSHNLIRQVYKHFEKEYGSVLCSDVREKINRDCPEVVARAAKWTAEVLLRQFTNYK
jgi:C_GCAxxG_C_C family probable redox protein